MSKTQDGWTEDGFLGGRLTIAQPRDGYRGGTDPVFLAAAMTVAPGERVLELGCGVGVAALCLLARVPEAQVVGVEKTPAYVAAARANAAGNGLSLEVVEADLATMPKPLRQESFDHVMTNPPWYPPDAVTAPNEAGRAGAHVEASLGLEAWVDAGLRRLTPGGSFVMIHRAERLAPCLSALDGRAGDVTVLPIAARQGQAAGRILIRARKARRGPLRLLSPLVVHGGVTHRMDGADFSQEAEAVLRGGAALSWD